jgi:hypothetical protein
VNCFRLEEGPGFRVLMDQISEIKLIDIWVSSSISYSCPKEHPREDCESFES